MLLRVPVLLDAEEPRVSELADARIEPGGVLVIPLSAQR